MVEKWPLKTAALDLVVGSIETSRAASFFISSSISFSQAKNSTVTSPLQLGIVCISFPCVCSCAGVVSCLPLFLSFPTLFRLCSYNTVHSFLNHLIAEGKIPLLDCLHNSCSPELIPGVGITHNASFI